MVNKQFYKLATTEGITEVIKFIESKGVKIIWAKIHPNMTVMSDPIMYCPFKLIPAIPRNMRIYTNRDVSTLIAEIKRVLSIISNYEEYDKKLEDNEEIIGIKELYEQS